MENDKFPKGGLPEPVHAPELFLRDFEFVNYHINHDKWDLIRGFDIIDAHRFIEDFCCDELSSCWIETKVERGSGAATAVCPDMVNGVLLLTTDNFADDEYELVQDCECWKLLRDYPLYAEIRFLMPDALNAGFWFGLINDSFYFWYNPDDFAVFDKDEGDRELDVHVAKNTVQTMVLAVATLQDYTWYRIGLHWDGDGILRWFVFRDEDAPQYCLATGQVTVNIPDDEELALGFGVDTGVDVAKSLYVDYVKCVQKRVIET